MSKTNISPNIFNNLECEAGLQMLQRLKGIPLSQVSFRNLEIIKEKVKVAMAAFMPLDDLSKNPRTRNVMALRKKGGLSAVVTKIFDFIQENPEKNLNGDWHMEICVFNRLADSSLGKDNGPEDMAGYQQSANEIFADLYHSITIKTAEA